VLVFAVAETPCLVTEDGVHTSQIHGRSNKILMHCVDFVYQIF
jgi:hypothetical protein